MIMRDIKTYVLDKKKKQSGLVYVPYIIDQDVEISFRDVVYARLGIQTVNPNYFSEILINRR
jgi:hypothetical protein